jgi:hypothetical protein
MSGTRMAVSVSFIGSRRLWMRHPSLNPIATSLLLIVLSCGPAGADIAERTRLLSLYAGSSLSNTARNLGIGGYELSDGTPISLRNWYRPHFPELTLNLFTQVSEGFGVVWGASTGERGQKYRINPALHLGFVAQKKVFKNSVLTLSFTAVLGGSLKERACSADYGPFGVTAVNCRLAASELPPEETLDYLVDIPGSHGTRTALRFDYWF